MRAQHVYEVGGNATKVRTTHSVASRPHDAELRLAIKDALKYPPVVLSGEQALAIGRGFGAISRKIELAIHACAILPDHAHLVVAWHRLNGNELIEC